MSRNNNVRRLALWVGLIGIALPYGDAVGQCPTDCEVVQVYIDDGKVKVDKDEVAVYASAKPGQKAQACWKSRDGDLGDYKLRVKKKLLQADCFEVEEADLSSRPCVESGPPECRPDGGEKKWKYKLRLVRKSDGEKVKSQDPIVIIKRNP